MVEDHPGDAGGQGIRLFSVLEATGENDHRVGGRSLRVDNPRIVADPCDATRLVGNPGPRREAGRDLC